MESAKRLEVAERRIFGGGSTKVVQVPGDGNCLFYATVQQVTGWRVFDWKFVEKAAELRKQVVAFIRNNREQFEELIANEIVLEDEEQSSVGMDDTDEQGEQDQVTLFLKKLEKDHSWGGSECLLAIGQLTQQDVEIISPNVPATVIPVEGAPGGDDTGSGRKIVLYYNGWNHYESVVIEKDNGGCKSGLKKGGGDEHRIRAQKEMSQGVTRMEVEGEKGDLSAKECKGTECMEGSSEIPEGASAIAERESYQGVVHMEVDGEGGCVREQGSNEFERMGGMSEITSGAFAMGESELNQGVVQMEVDGENDCVSGQVCIGSEDGTDTWEEAGERFYIENWGNNKILIRSTDDTSNSLWDSILHQLYWNNEQEHIIGMKMKKLKEILEKNAPCNEKDSLKWWEEIASSLQIALVIKSKEEGELTFNKQISVSIKPKIKLWWNNEDKQWFGSIIAEKKKQEQRRDIDDADVEVKDRVRDVGNNGTEVSERDMNVDEKAEGSQGIIYIASWNVRGCCKQEKREEIDEILNYYRIDIAALQEVNIAGSSCETKNYVWSIAKGSQNKSRGLAILIPKLSDYKILEIIEIGKWGIKARISLGNEKEIEIFNVHGPNKNISSFLSDLGTEINKCRNLNNRILVGDWNAQIGKDSVVEEDSEVIGKRLGFLTCNDNGEEFKAFLHVHNLINLSSKIGVNTNVTFKSGEIQSQIDHVLKPVNNKLTVRNIRGYWTKLRTDHKLIISKVVLKGVKSMINQRKRKLSWRDASALKLDTIKKKYQEKLREMSKQKKGSESIDEQFKNLAERMKKAAKEALQTVKEPLTPKRKTALNRLNRALEMANKHPDMNTFQWKLENCREEFAAEVKRHKEEEITKEFKKMDDFDVNVRMQKSFKILKPFIQQRKNRNVYISRNLWNEALRACEGPELNLLQQHDTCPLTAPPTESEMRMIVNNSCNGKSPGPDGLRMEMLKYADKETFDELMEIWTKIWINNELPDDMLYSTQIPLPKVRNPKTTNDFRRISLSSVAYKPYAKWLKNRLRDFTGELDLNQAAFSEGRSTDDHVFLTKRIMEEYWNSGRVLYLAALDISKAFDNVKLDILKEILLEMQVPTHLIDRVLSCIKDDRIRIKYMNQLSEEVKRGRGIKQGCPLSPFLFNIVIQYILRKVHQEVPELKAIRVGLLKLPLIIAFADDLLVMAESKAVLEKVIESVEQWLLKVGLEINHKKTQVMVRAPNNIITVPEQIILNGRSYDVCRTIKYLGVTLTSTLNRPATTRQRCISAVKTTKVVVEFCRKFKPSWEIGKLIYKTVIAPAILYGTKVSTLTKRSRLQIARFEKLLLKDIWNSCRRVEGQKFNVRKLLDGKTMNRRVRIVRISFVAHIERRPPGHPLKLAFALKFNRKKKGRPSFTFRESVEEDLARFEDTVTEEWSELYKDKHKLKKVTEGLYERSESEISEGESESE